MVELFATINYSESLYIPLFRVSCRVVGGHAFIIALLLSVLWFIAPFLICQMTLGLFLPLVICTLNSNCWHFVQWSPLCRHPSTPCSAPPVFQVTHTTTAWVPWALARCWAPSPPSSSTPTQRPCWDAPSRLRGSRSWRSSWRTTLPWGQRTSQRFTNQTWL